MTAQAPQKNSYKGTLNLPQTSFPMEAKLTTNEPLRLAAWTEGRLYEKLLIHRAKSPKWILHDGPPFANGDIHIGHLINKTLKDVILRFRTMQGFQTPYVPGWDCHGLPIEHKIQQESGAETAADGRRRSPQTVLCLRGKICRHPERAIPTPGHPWRMEQSLPHDEPGIRGCKRSKSSRASSKRDWFTSSSSRSPGRSKTRRLWRMRNSNTTM